jgi:hypothetical protein
MRCRRRRQDAAPAERADNSKRAMLGGRPSIALRQARSLPRTTRDSNQPKARNSMWPKMPAQRPPTK